MIKGKTQIVIGLFIVSMLLAALGVAYQYRYAIKGEVMSMQAKLQLTPTAPFKSIDTHNFTSSQIRLYETLKREYTSHPKSFDTNLMKYTDGVKQPWCADFVSWVMQDIGQPFRNPHSGSWRIPGVYTLREYYQVENRWQQKTKEYVPQFGDVAIFTRTPNDLHTAIVMSVDQTRHTMLTTGGNEKGTVDYRTHSYTTNNEHLAGYGKLKE